MFSKRWHVVSYDLLNSGISQETRTFISAHRWHWFAKQAQGLYYEWQQGLMGPVAPAGFVPKSYRIERAY